MRLIRYSAILLYLPVLPFSTSQMARLRQVEKQTTRFMQRLQASEVGDFYFRYQLAVIGGTKIETCRTTKQKL